MIAGEPGKDRHLRYEGHTDAAGTSQLRWWPAGAAHQYPRGVTNYVEADVRDTDGVPYRLRSVTEITRFFDGLELVVPGVVTPHP